MFLWKDIFSGWGCYMNTQLSHKSKCHNDINLVALNLGIINNRKLHFCLTFSVNCKIVYFEHLNKPLRTICV